jgi:glutathionylspermidine synthase
MARSSQLNPAANGGVFVCWKNQHPVLGSWLIDHTPCGLSIREDEKPITGNTARFLPHVIL